MRKMVGVRLGVWDWHVQTTLYKIDTQQGPIYIYVGIAQEATQYSVII